MKDNSLVLCDIGVRKYNLNSDITTTFPVNGKFTKHQKDIYDIVLESQQTAINMIKPGVLWGDACKESNKITVKGLLALGILKGDLENLLELGISRVFMPHSLSHYIGNLFSK